MSKRLIWVEQDDFTVTDSKPDTYLVAHMRRHPPIPERSQALRYLGALDLGESHTPVLLVFSLSNGRGQLRRFLASPAPRR